MLFDRMFGNGIKLLIEDFLAADAHREGQEEWVGKVATWANHSQRQEIVI